MVIKIKKSWQLIRTAPSFLGRSVKKRLNHSLSPHVYYVVPAKGWVTDWVGHYITNHIHHQFQIPITTTATPHLLTQHILHYGEMGAYLASLNKSYNRRNRLIATIFHGNIENCPDALKRNTEKFMNNIDQLTYVVTSANLMQKRLIAWGVPAKKVHLIPLGIDLNRFIPSPTAEHKIAQRRKLNIPPEAFCLGSFQKDGAGWADGLTPKLEKGPDIFLDVVAQLYQRHPHLFVLLTGPARGYMKRGLDKIGVPYRHDFLANYHDIIEHYHCLDGYLVTSREEGGPKAILEALATDVPLVTTKVGLAPDLIVNGANGLMTEINDIEALTSAVNQLIEHKATRDHLIKNGRDTITNFSWAKIAEQYYHFLYQPLLDQPH